MGIAIEQVKLEIEKYTRVLKTAEQEKIQAETNLTNARNTLTEVIKDMTALGTSPDAIQDDIEKLEKTIREQISQIEEYLKGDTNAV